MACIGPTTREYLATEFRFEVDVCAEVPSPEGVGRGIERFMRENETKSGCAVLEGGRLHGAMPGNGE